MMHRSAASMMPPRLQEILSIAVLAALMQGCVRLPSMVGRTTSLTIEETADTRLGRAVLPLVRAHPDTTGVVALRDGRGVRVRLLLDDNNIRGLDPLLAALDAHPRIEVRLSGSVIARPCAPGVQRT